MFCLETERSISNDWVVRHENRYLPLERQSDYPPRQAKVTVCEWEDGRIEIRYKGKARPHREIGAPRLPKYRPIRLVARPPRRSTWKPSSSHPWRRLGRAAAMLRATASARPKRSAWSLAGLRSGSGPQHGKELVTKEKKGHF